MANETGIFIIHSPSLYGEYAILHRKEEAAPTSISDNKLTIDGLGYKSMGEINRLRARFTRAGNLDPRKVKLIGREIKRLK